MYIKVANYIAIKSKTWDGKRSSSVSQCRLVIWTRMNRPDSNYRRIEPLGVHVIIIWESGIFVSRTFFKYSSVILSLATTDEWGRFSGRPDEVFTDSVTRFSSREEHVITTTIPTLSMHTSYTSSTLLTNMLRSYLPLPTNLLGSLVFRNASTYSTIFFKWHLQ